MKITYYIFCLALLLSIGKVTYAEGLSVENPNVLFIVIDDMNGYAVFNEYPVKAKTPNIDDLKEQSLTFTKAYCAVAKCVPSRAATWSGLPANITGAYLDESKPWNNSNILKDCEALPECFQRNGYDTWARGKTFHNNPPNGRHGDMWNNKYHGGGFGPWIEPEHQIQGQWWGSQAFPDQQFPDVYNTDSALNYIAKKHDTPFFLTVGLYRPHTPFTAPQRFFDMYNIDSFVVPPWYLESDLDDVPQAGKDLIDFNDHWRTSGVGNEDNWKRLIWAYMACNSFVDYNIGRLVTALEDNNLDDSTIIVIWSDHGYHCGEKNHWEKSLMWEQATNAPLFIKIPGMPSAGEVYDAPVSLIDIYPTLVDYCNLDGPENELAGISLRPFIENTSLVLNRPIVSFNQKNHVSIRSYQYRYMQYPDGEEELYNHETDPHEHTNLAGNSSYNSIKNELKSWIPATMNTFSSTSYVVEDVEYDTLEFVSTVNNVNQHSEINIYPNPAGNEVFIETGTHSFRNVKIYDINGKIVNANLQSDGVNRMKLYTGNFIPGQYIIHIKTNETFIIKSILVI